MILLKLFEKYIIIITTATTISLSSLVITISRSCVFHDYHLYEFLYYVGRSMIVASSVAMERTNKFELSMAYVNDKLDNETPN